MTVMRRTESNDCAAKRACHPKEKTHLHEQRKKVHRKSHDESERKELLTK